MCRRSLLRIVQDTAPGHLVVDEPGLVRMIYDWLTDE
jgi:hypothetical protein